MSTSAGSPPSDHAEHDQAVMTTDDPYAAYTELAENYESGWGEDDFDTLLPPFTRGVLAAAGRLLAILAYRDALAYRDKPLRRRAAKAKHTVLALMPPACDGRDLEFRLAAARCFDDLAADLLAGRAPLARCTGEVWAWGVLLERAPHVLAASDAELAALEVTVPVDAYQSPYWEPLWSAFTLGGAEHSIAEAQPADPHDEDAEYPDPPAGGWDGPDLWFSPYAVAVPRDAQRGYPAWVTDALGGAAPRPAGATFDRAAQLTGLAEVPDPWSAYTDDYGAHVNGLALAEVLTPLTGRLLAAAADQLADFGHHELLTLGNTRLVRDEDGWDDESFFQLLPAICDAQNAAWRLAMVRAVTDLADDLRAARAPLPRCNAEEVALHLILVKAGEMLDWLDSDDEFADIYGVPPAAEFSARHRKLNELREHLFQDDDFLMFYDRGMADVAADPDHEVMQMLHIGDLRPRAWWWTFGNLRPRDAGRGFDPEALAALTAALGLPSGPAPEHAGAMLPDGLAEEFEHFVGLAQGRFFDEPRAIAMARSLYNLLDRVMDTPGLPVGQPWASGSRAVVDGQMLLASHDFTVDGLKVVWRLHADESTDEAARAWSLDLLADCAHKILHHFASGMPALLGDPHAATRPTVDTTLINTVGERIGVLARAGTLAQFLRARRTALGLTVAQVTDAALLPAHTITSWEDGAIASPSQLIRLAPVLQLPEDVLLKAADGTRDGYWPLPTVPHATLKRYP